MNKRYISLSIVLLLAIGTLPALFANGETHFEFPEIDIIPDGCYQWRLIQSENETLPVGQTAIYHPPKGIREDCFYVIYMSGRDNCVCIETERCAAFYAIIKLKNGQELRLPDKDYFDPCCGDSISIETPPIPGSIVEQIDYIGVYNYTESDCSITYSWKLYSLCPCKSMPALYPKVDIEQFSVTGGDTIIRDGKILTNFNVIPGVQQTFIQVENRGFFTQNDVKVRVMGLPEGVTMSITPDTQKIKAHKIGTYQATFEVGPNVPSGTYKVTMMAYSDNGVFDTIQIDLIVP